jgi:hypothetical protein
MKKQRYTCDRLNKRPPPSNALKLKNGRNYFLVGQSRNLFENVDEPNRGEFKIMRLYPDKLEIYG